MNILVTGGAGFIGSNLCRELIKDPNNNVICLDNMYTGHHSNIEDLYEFSNFLFVEGSILDLHKLHIKKSIAQIYHLACPASPPAYQEDPLYTIKVNTNGTMNVLELAKSMNARVLYTSTSEVYGDPTEHPQHESHLGNVNTLGPRACYDVGKRMGETICYEYCKKGVSVVIARIFNTYGPFMSPDDGRVVTNFIKQCIQGKDITIYGNGRQTRSLCYVSDMVNGLIKLMNSKIGSYGPFNIGNDHEMSILEIAKMIIKLTGSTSQLTFHPLPQDDPTRRCPDIQKINQAIGWYPIVNPEQGLKKTIEYVAEKMNNQSKLTDL